MNRGLDQKRRMIRYLKTSERLQKRRDGNFAVIFFEAEKIKHTS